MSAISMCPQAPGLRGPSVDSHHGHGGERGDLAEEPGWKCTISGTPKHTEHAQTQDARRVTKPEKATDPGKGTSRHMQSDPQTQTDRQIHRHHGPTPPLLPASSLSPAHREEKPAESVGTLAPSHLTFLSLQRSLIKYFDRT